MNTKLLLQAWAKKALLLGTLLLLSVFCFEALAQQTGSVRGRVLDETNGEPLPGANVVLKGTLKGASTDLSGYYQINFVPMGTQVLVISYLGYREQEVSVQVNPGQLTQLNINLASEASVLGEIVVKGLIEGQEKALNQQRTADNIKNVISADLIGRFPDLNVAEALMRIPGINIERDRGEGGEVQLRGAPASFTTININGEQIPGTQSSGQRNEELSLIPVDQLTSIEVTKAITSDQDGDNIGGTVDLRTPIAKGPKPKMKMELGGGYNNIVEKLNFIGKFGYNQRFMPSAKVDEGRLGLVLGGSYFATDNGRDRTQYQYTSRYTVLDETQFVLPTFYRLRDLENQRTRTGLSATLDYKFNTRHSMFFNYMYSRRFDRDEERRTQFDFNTTAWQLGEASPIPNFNTNTSVRRFVNPREQEINNHTFTIGGEHQLGTWQLDYLLFLSDSRNSANKGRSYDLRSNAFVAEIQNFYTDFANVTSPGVDVHNPFLIESFRDYVDQEDIVESRNTSAKFNLSRPFQVNAYQGLFKFGGKFRTIENSRERLFTEFDFQNDGTVSLPNLFPAFVSNVEDQQFMLNRVRFGPTLDFNQMDAFIAANPTLFRFDEINSRSQSVPQFYDAREDVYAAYAMGKLNVRKFMLLAGFRYERTNVSYEANRADSDGEDIIEGTIERVSGERNFNFFLPNFHAKYQIDNLTNLRAALTWSFARSNFVDLVPFQIINLREVPIDGTDPNSRPIGNINEGNINLNPARAINFDLLFERYLKNVGIVSGGVFYKRIRDFNFVREFTETRPFTYTRGDGQVITGPVDFNIEQAQNGQVAHLYGAEINVQWQLDFLPGPLEGLGVYANYTFTHSDASTLSAKTFACPARHGIRAMPPFLMNTKVSVGGLLSTSTERSFGASARTWSWLETKMSILRGILTPGVPTVTKLTFRYLTTFGKASGSMPNLST
ncbi:MAG: TonB-dependent receptor [Microscillaceae bacterium]|nr:TonB-dependent receptor [Microscillaceae bacterium]